MRQVLARRDENWKKLQRYVLDERELIDIRGPGRTPIWGERREYTWYIRDGFFVRSPVKFNGVAIAESERRKFEADYLKRQQARERRQPRDRASAQPPSSSATESDGSAPGEQISTERAGGPAPSAGIELDGLLKQTRQPEFISSAYFLRFKFEEGKYALVGHETLDGRDVLRIEYYPARLFSDDQRRRQAKSHDEKDPWDAEMQRMLNKVALVTLWVEPASHQIVKYTFDNVDFDFLPEQWLFRLETVRATMTMDQPFPDVWLPRDLEFVAAVDVAAGRFDVRY